MPLVPGGRDIVLHDGNVLENKAEWAEMNFVFLKAIMFRVAAAGSIGNFKLCAFNAHQVEVNTTFLPIMHWYVSTI